MGIWVKILTGSDGAAALTFFAYLAGLLLGPLTGMVIDRFRRRPMLIGVDLGAALWVCLLLAAGDGRLWLIYLVMFVYGVVSSLKFAAQAALLQEIAPVELLGEANSVLQVAEQGLRIVTPLLGAGLLTLGGPRPVILLNAVLFLLAAAGTTAIRHDEAAPVPSGERFWPEFTAGARFIRRTAALRVVVLSGVIALISAGLHQNVIWAVVDDGLHRPPAFVGVLQTASGIGAVLGGLVAAAVMRRTGERALMAAGLCAMTVAAVPLMLLSWTPTVVLAMALNGAGVVGVNVGEATLVQRLTPRALLGRVNSAVNVTMLVPQTAAIAVGGIPGGLRRLPPAAGGHGRAAAVQHRPPPPAGRARPRSPSNPRPSTRRRRPRHPRSDDTTSRPALAALAAVISRRARDRHAAAPGCRCPAGNRY